MKSYSKSCVAIAALSLGVVAAAQHHGGSANPTVFNPPMPQPYTGPISEAVPSTIQAVMKIGNRVIPLGPKLAYHPSNHHANRVGALIFDAFEGNSANNANPDVPTDGLYGETFLPATPGSRWYEGNTFVNTAFVRRFENEFPGQAGKPATGIDLVVYNNPTGNNITDILFFTSSDPLGSPTAPTNFNSGVDINYGAGLTPGGWYSNVDLSTLSPLFAMPTGSNGWFEEVLASAVDPVTGQATEASAAQPLLWGTKALNASVASNFEYMDGTGTGTDRTGTASNLFTWDFAKYSTPTSYTVNTGVESGTHDPTKLNGTPGTNVVVRQSGQAAQVTATVTLDPATAANASLRLLRAIVVAKAGLSPLSNSTLTVSWLNNSTSAFDTLYSGQSINQGTDGTVISPLPALQGLSIPNLPGLPSPAIANLPNYIATDGSGNRTVTIRINVHRNFATPLSANWNLTINKIQVAADVVGPNPLCPSVAFSTTQ